MDIIYESADNFKKITDNKYRFVISHKRKTREIILDFSLTDYRHASGLHYVTDIAIERNPVKLLDAILETPHTVTDSILEKSRKYKETSPTMGSVKERVSNIRFLENCLDISDYIRIYEIQPFGSAIVADYYIETYCKEIDARVYIFIRKRDESDTYVVVSFFRNAGSNFRGTSLYWMLKEKITPSGTIELYRNKNYNE